MKFPPPHCCKCFRLRLVALIVAWAAFCGHAHGETVTVTEPGTLKEMMIDLDGTPEDLTINGVLNSADLAYINVAQGKMGSVKRLDLTGVKLDYDGGMYAATSGKSTLDGLYGNLTQRYYLTADNSEKRDSTPNLMGGWNRTIEVYSNDLAGLFLSNKSFVEVKLPATLESIGTFAFAKSSVKSVVAPALRGIGERAFEQSEIDEINLEKVESLGAYAFADCSSLSGELVIENIISIPRNCFANTSITSLRINGGLKRIEHDAFVRSRIKSVALPGSVEVIGRRAFDCALETVDVPATLQYIGAYAFGVDNPWINAIPVEEGVKYIGDVAYAYAGGGPMETITFKEGTRAISGGFTVGAETRPSLKSVVFPSSLRMIGDVNDYDAGMGVTGCFADCDQLKDVVLPDGLRVIGPGTFSGCKSLGGLTLPESLEAIGYMAFDDCNALSQVKLYSASLSTCLMPGQGYSPFGRNSYIEKVTIGGNVGIIPQGMFDGCSGLAKVVFEEGTNSPDLTFEDSAFNGCSSLKLAELPVRTVSVGENAFCGVTFGETFRTNRITHIGGMAFSGAKGIKNLTLDDDLQVCGGGAFGIESIEKIVCLAHNINTKEYGSEQWVVSCPFYQYDGNVKEIVIGSGVERIPEQFFSNLINASSKISLTFEPRSNLASRDMEPTGLEIGSKAFCNNRIRIVTLPDASTEIGRYAFGGCGVSELRLGDGTVTIAEEAFCGSSMSTVDVPATVREIGANAFNQSYSYLKNIYFHTDEPPVLGDGFVKNSVTLYVPSTSEQAYRQATDNKNKVDTYSLTSFVLDKETAAVDADGTVRLSVKIQPAVFSGLDITWETSDASVATVDCNGVVKGLSQGTAKITARPTYLDGFSAECEVTVGSDSGIDDLPYTSAPSAGEVEIYNLQGVKMTCESIEDLAPGIYILRRGAASSKLVVR